MKISFKLVIVFLCFFPLSSWGNWFLTEFVSSQRIQTVNVRRWNLWIWCCSSVSSSGTTSSPMMPTCAPSSLEETCPSAPPLGPGRQQERMQTSTMQRTMTWRWRYGPGRGVPPPETRLCWGTAVRGIVWGWKGDRFQLYSSCFKAHLSLLLTHTQKIWTVVYIS